MTVRFNKLFKIKSYTIVKILESVYDPSSLSVIMHCHICSVNGEHRAAKPFRNQGFPEADLGSMSDV